MCECISLKQLSGVSRMWSISSGETLSISLRTISYIFHRDYNKTFSKEWRNTEVIVSLCQGLKLHLRWIRRQTSLWFLGELMINFLHPNIITAIYVNSSLNNRKYQWMIWLGSKRKPTIKYQLSWLSHNEIC